MLLLVYNPDLGHCEVANDGEHGEDAHLRKEVTQAVAIISAGACEEHPHAHARSDVGHDQNGPLKLTGIQVDLTGLTFFLARSVNCHEHKKQKIANKHNPHG